MLQNTQLKKSINYTSIDQEIKHSKEQMSEKEILDALSFLKTTFPKISLKKILFSLTKQLIKTKQTQKYQLFSNGFLEKISLDRNSEQKKLKKKKKMFGSWNNQMTEYERIEVRQREQKEYIKTIAIFLKQDAKYKDIKLIFPKITRREYDSKINKINDVIIEAIQMFIVHEGHCKIKYLSRSQKCTLKKYLAVQNVWMSNNQRQTFNKFIQWKYQSGLVYITFTQTLLLYRKFLEILRNQNSQKIQSTAC